MATIEGSGLRSFVSVGEEGSLMIAFLAKAGSHLPF